MPNPAPGFASRPDYRVDLVPESRRVKVVFGGVTVADSGAALRVEETGHGPVHYIPEKNVRLDLMRRTDHHTRCPYKGEASYWTIEVPAGETAPRILTKPPGWVLEVPDGTVDTVEFARLVREGRELLTARQPKAAAGVWQLWDGESELTSCRDPS